MEKLKRTESNTMPLLEIVLLVLLGSLPSLRRHLGLLSIFA
jgi:hypothetical protein